MAIIATAIFVSFQHGDYNSEALKKAARSYLLQLDYATKEVLLNYSTEGNMLTLKSLEGESFSVNDTGSEEKLIPLYKEFLGSKPYTPPSEYLSARFVNEAGNNVGASEFNLADGFSQGFKARNGAYISFRIYHTSDPCTGNQSVIYDPSSPETHDSPNSCGYLFFDINADAAPNIVGVDQYLISIGKLGLK